MQHCQFSYPCTINFKDRFKIHRVKSLSKSGNPKKDQVSSSSSQLTNKESSTIIPAPSPTDADDVCEQYRDVKSTDTNRRVVDKGNLSYHSTADLDRQSASFPSNSLNIREEAGMISTNMDKEKIDVKNAFGGSTSNKVPLASFPQHSVDTEEKVQKVSPPRRKAHRDEKTEKVGNWLRKDTTSSTQSTTTFKQQNPGSSDKDNMVSRQPESPMDGNINDILEVGRNVAMFIH